MSQDQMNRVELSLEKAKAHVEMGVAMQKLLKNRDFKKVVSEGYFKEEATRLVLLKADPECAAPEIQVAIDKAITGIGEVSQYFRTIVVMAGQAERAITADEQTLDELRNEMGE
jgi:hypothetical protein